MTHRSDNECAQRLRTALDLAESGIQMRLAQLRRDHPDEEEPLIRQRLQDWLLSRPDAGYGSAVWRHVEPSSLLTP
ncbi:MAG: hypothetical protein ACOC9J_01685 [Persicimonas sp.]